MPTAGTEIVGSSPQGRRWRLPAWDPSLTVWIAAALFLVLLMLFPLAAIFSASVRNETGLTLSKYAEVFSNPVYLKAIWNTIVVSFWVGIFALGIGGVLGWLVTRTDLPFKRTVRAL